MRRPDDGDVSGFAEPEDLLLDLGEPSEADLDGEVAARDHDRERLRAGALDDDVGEVAYRDRGLDLGGDRERVGRARARSSSS